MSKITRFTQKLFGSTASNNKLAQFGSFAAGSPLRYSGATVTPTLIQALSNYLSGWEGAVVGSNAPTLEDMNALHYLFSYQLGYMLQTGIPEYDSGTTYYKGSFVSDTGGAGLIYVSLTDSNVGNALTSATNWQLVGGRQNTKNFLVNSAFDYWQANSPSSGVTGITNGSWAYGPDQWVTQNALGTGGVVQIVPTTGALNGSILGASVSVTSTPSSPLGPGASLFQFLDNPATMQLYNQTATFTCQVKAVGNTNQVSVAFVYATSEGSKSSYVAYGPSSAATVSTSGFTTISVTQALGSSMTTSGIIGVSIAVTGVSTGQKYTSGNGFIVEQAQVNLGALPCAYQRLGSSQAEELVACQRFYEKSYEVNIAPGTNATTGAFSFYIYGVTSMGSRLVGSFVGYKVTKRAGPAISFYPTPGGTAGNITDVVASNSNIAASTVTDGSSGFSWYATTSSTASPNVAVLGHFTADSRL